MSRTQKILFFATGWLIVLMPFLFWWNTWFGRHLTDQQLTEYLHDDKKPRHIQHALVQLGDRMSRSDANAKQWYPDLVRLASHPVEEVRNTDAWVMGQDTSGPGFHDTLLKMLQDLADGARQCGALARSLRRFQRPVADRSLARNQRTSPRPLPDNCRFGPSRHRHPSRRTHRQTSPTDSSQLVEIRSPIPGRIRSVSQTGANVVAGAEIAVIDPATDQAWEALRALYIIGQGDDLAAIRPYERDLPDISNDVRQQARRQIKRSASESRQVAPASRRLSRGRLAPTLATKNHL